MAKNKKPKLTKRQQEYKHELSLLKKRARRWQKTDRILFEDFSSMPERVTEKDIKKLRSIRKSTFTEKQKQTYRENYEEAYEQGRITIPEKNNKPYSPPTEQDYLNNQSIPTNEIWEDTDNEPAHYDAEIQAWIDDIIEAILDTSGIVRVNYAVRETFNSLLGQLRVQLGDKGFYEYMSTGQVVNELHNIAYTGMSTSPTKGTQAPGAGDAIAHFTFILNNSTPLTDKQAEDLAEVIETEGYYGSVNFDAFEDEL